jgi:hypothetical protein
MSILIGIAFAVILGALAWAGVAMLRGSRDGDPKGENMMRALAVRIAISVLLFACILVAWSLGWIHPTGLALQHG